MALTNVSDDLNLGLGLALSCSLRYYSSRLQVRCARSRKVSVSTSSNSAVTESYNSLLQVSAAKITRTSRMAW
jgi:hypothetical protein